jgi:dTDP-4-dehydrorhamnose reductase
MIWLIGEKGMLGQQLAEEFKANSIDYIGTDLDVDITDEKALTAFADGKSIDWIINCSAYTAVDKAESEEAKAMLINGTGVGNIAKAAQLLDAKLIHFSTDYVFDGTKDGIYTEADTVNPQSAYGRTKLEGEKQLRAIWDKSFIIRISWLYGIHGPNFVKTMLRLFSEKPELGVIHDQIGSPTYAKTLAENIRQLVQTDNCSYGIYLYADNGYISWYDFTVKIKELALSHDLLSKDLTINPISTEQYPLPAPRPANSRFCKDKIKNNLGFTVKNWDDNLADFISTIDN